MEFLCGRGRQVTGVDYHEMFLDVARQRSGTKGTYVQGDITALPFRDKQFESTYCFDVLEHVDDIKALAELVRVTQARIIVAVPATDDGSIGGGLTFHHYRDLTHFRTYTEESLRLLFESVGQKHFEILRELPVNLQLIAGTHLQTSQTRNPMKAAARNFYNTLLRFLLRHARYRTFHSGLAAVIELESGLPPTP